MTQPIVSGARVETKLSGSKQLSHTAIGPPSMVALTCASYTP